VSRTSKFERHSYPGVPLRDWCRGNVFERSWGVLPLYCIYVATISSAGWEVATLRWADNSHQGKYASPLVITNRRYTLAPLFTMKGFRIFSRRKWMLQQILYFDHVLFAWIVRHLCYNSFDAVWLTRPYCTNPYIGTTRVGFLVELFLWYIYNLVASSLPAWRVQRNNVYIVLLSATW